MGTAADSALNAGNKNRDNYSLRVFDGDHLALVWVYSAKVLSVPTERTPI